MVDANATFNWAPLESNPEIFADYMKTVGMPNNWTFGEIYGFEEDLLAFIPTPCVAVIINAEFLKKEEDRAKGDISVANDYYMKQTDVLDNACGVIACIHAILNNLGEGEGKITLKEGSVLANMRTACASMSAEERAAALEANADFSAVHTSFAAEGQSNQAEHQEDVKHHFVAFVVNSAG